MDICATNIFKSWNRRPWYCFKLRPLFLPSSPPPTAPLPSIRRNKLPGSLGKTRHFIVSDGCHIAWVHSAPPVWPAKNPCLGVAQGKRGESQRLPENGLCRFCSTFVKPKPVGNERPHWRCTLLPATQAHSLERGGGGCQFTFWGSPEGTEKVLPTPLAWLKTLIISVSENRRKKARAELLSS